jgi:SAM-dependent methyltransferase
VTPDGHDRFELYVQFFQNPTVEVERLRRICEATRITEAYRLREDFCGTAANCLAWVRAGANHTADGVDIDPEPLAWSRTRYLPTLSDDELGRLQLVEGDAIATETERVDVILAANLSFCVYKRRSELREYLSRCFQRLAPGGIVVLEICGGPEILLRGADRDDSDGVTAVWDQESINQLTNEAVSRIHFEFSDGTRLERAFTFDWRVWSTAELRELLHDSGFGTVRIFARCYATDGNLLPTTHERDHSYADTYWTVDVVGIR